MTIPTESETWTVPVGDATTTAIFDPAFEAGGHTVVVFGHGASSHLHPAGQPEKLRKDHLADIRVPTLCCNGTRDELCSQEIMAPIVATLPRWTMHWFDHADHSFHVRKKDGRTDEEVSKEFGLTVATWLAANGFSLQHD